MTTDEADIKLRILLAAKKLFALQGFDGTTVRQICEDAGANVALVSYYFGGKEGLFTEIMRTYSPNERAEQVPDDMDPVQGIIMLIREVTIFRYQEPELISIVQQEVIRNSPRIQNISQHMGSVWQLLYKLLDRGREQGIFTFHSLDTTFMSIIGMLIMPRHTAYWSKMVGPEQPDIETAIKDMTDFILKGLQ